MKLYQMVDLLRRRIDTKDVLYNGNSSEAIDGKQKELYEGFLEGRFKTDEEAANALFGKGADYPYYFEVKAKFREQLLRNIFHINYNSSKYHYYNTQEIQCEISLLQSKILLRNGLKENAIWLLKRTLKTAEGFHFTYIIRECCMILKNQMVYSGNIKKFEEYRKKWEELREVEEAEIEAEDLLSQVRIRSQRSVREIKESFDLAKFAYKRISELRYKFDTPNLIQLHNFMANSYYMRTADWEKAVELANEIEVNSRKHPDKYAAIRIKSVHISKLYALILLGRIEEGLTYIEEVLDEYRGDESGYFIILEDYYLLCMRASNYQKALEIVEMAMHSKYFDLVQSFSKERWEIYREHALFFAGKASDHDISLINYFPEYSKDKVGFNLQILILQIMILLRDGRYEQLYNHIENLRYYEIRQISKSDNRRAQYFLRLIGLLARYEMDYEKCKKQGNKYYNLLKQFPEKEQPYTEVEIVPYETLWKTILSMLKTKPHLQPELVSNLLETH